MAEPIATLAQVREHLGIAAGDTDDDAWLTRTLGKVSRAIEQHCSRELRRAEWTLVLDCPDGKRLWLDKYAPIESVTSVKEASDRDFDAADALTENTDYLVYPNAIERIGVRFDVEGATLLECCAFAPEIGSRPTVRTRAMRHCLNMLPLALIIFVLRLGRLLRRERLEHATKRLRAATRFRLLTKARQVVDLCRVGDLGQCLRPVGGHVDQDHLTADADQMDELFGRKRRSPECFDRFTRQRPLTLRCRTSEYPRKKKEQTEHSREASAHRY